MSRGHGSRGGRTAAQADGDGAPGEAGILYVVATPIGNLNDVTLRALEVLAGVDRIAAEDTRHTRRLLDRHGIRPPVLEPYHAHNEGRVAGRLANRIRRGESVALVTDAGTPGIADPAYRLTRAALEVGARVVPVPGASAVLAVLAASGLPTDRFIFEGFPPRKPGPRRRMLERLADLPHTLVFFEAPPRVGNFLADILVVLGDREIAVGRELTKIHEEIWRGTVGAYLEGVPEGASPKGASPKGASPKGASLKGASPKGVSPKGASPGGARLKDGTEPRGEVTVAVAGQSRKARGQRC